MQLLLGRVLVLVLHVLFLRLNLGRVLVLVLHVLFLRLNLGRVFPSLEVGEEEGRVKLLLRDRVKELDPRRVGRNQKVTRGEDLRVIKSTTCKYKYK